jgi:hypothetical protein
LKIWFKSAYQCAYCGYIIHIKCYEKTIGKAICPRFYSKQASISLSTGSAATVTSFTNNANPDDQFVVIQSPAVNTTAGEATTPGGGVGGSLLSPDGGQQQQPKSMVSNFISGIRQRASKRFQESDLPGHGTASSGAISNSVTSSTTSTGSAAGKSSLLNSLYSNFNKAKMVSFFV